MQKTIHILATHYADYQLDYESFFYDNRYGLEKAGIAYPWLVNWRDEFSWQMKLPQKLNDVKNGNTSALKELSCSLENCHSLLFVAPLGILTTSMPTLLSVIKGNFPEWESAKTNVVWLACERARQIDGSARYNLPRDVANDLFQSSIKNADKFLEDLAGFLEAGDTVKILPDLETGHVPEEDILEALGLELPLQGRVSLREATPASREHICMAAILKRLVPEMRLENMDKSPDAHLAMLPPGEMKRIYETVSLPVERIAGKYGAKFQFPPPAAQTDWRPFKFPDAALFQHAYENYVGKLGKSEQHFHLRVLENAEGVDWLTENAKEYARKLRDIFCVSEDPEPLLCVLTLTKNQAPYIAQCMESVLEQKTDFSVRHIILDDCSTDATPDIIREYALRNTSIYPIFLRPGRERGDNVRALFSACHSKYAALCDGDDYFIDPLKLQKQVDFLEAHPDCSLCFHPVEKRYEDGTPTEIYPPDAILPGGGKRRIYTIRDLLAGNMIQTNSVVYRWRFRDGLPDWFDATLNPSDWYWHLLHAETGMIGYLPEAMSVYRRHGSSLFASAEKGHVEHRVKHGHAELSLYAALDKHFKGRYRKDFQHLANGVFADYLRIYMDTGRDELFNRSVADFPFFAKDFLSEFKDVLGT